MTEVSNVANTVLTTLELGSGVDSEKLAEDLTNAVKVPQQALIQNKIDASEASISAYGLVKLQIDELKQAFEALNDANELATSTGSSSDITKMTLSSLTGSAVAGTYDFTVSQLAQNQRVISDQYTTTTQALNSGSAFNISLAVGTTKSAIAAVYSASVTPAETTTLVVGDGTTTVSVASATYSTIDQQVAAIQGATNYNSLLFTVAKNTAGDAIEFTYKAAGTVASTPTFTGSGSTHTITNPTVGVSVATPVTGVAAQYNVTATAAETTTLVASDGTNSISVASATYNSIADQVTAMQGASGYEDLLFTIAANDAGNGFKFTYKTTGAITTAPTLTGESSHTVSTTTTGVTAVNAATTTTINVITDTPAGVVSAINSANTGVTASLVDTGTGSNTYRILLSGQSGSDGVFTVTSTPDLGFQDTANVLQSAQDSIISYDGLTVTRSSNAINDVIDGATLNLLDTSASVVRLTIASDTSTFQSSIENVVGKYNDLNTLFGDLTDEDSDITLAGALSNDTSVVRFLKDKIKDSVFGTSSTPSGGITSIRDLGVSVNQYGTMTFSTTDYDSAVLTNYDNIVTMLTANTSGESLYSTSAKGLAQDVATVLDQFTVVDGLVSVRETNATSNLTDHEAELTALETRMDKVYQRYRRQFAAMETLMATLDTTKEYLTAQFETLSKAYEK